MNASLSSNDLHQESGALSPGLVVGLVLRPQSSWSKDFYPEDLPADWQLEYYANEFQSLYLNSDCVSESLLEGLEDLEEGFELLLELAPKTRTLGHELLKQCDIAVLATGADATQWQPELGDIRPVTVGQMEKQLYVQTVDEQPNARELRDSMENLMKVAESQRVYCYFDGKAAYATAQQAMTIAGLMGVLV